MSLEFNGAWDHGLIVDSGYYDDDPEEWPSMPRHIYWTCPACGGVRVGLVDALRPRLEVERHIIQDHIAEGCPAYRHTSS